MLNGSSGVGKTTIAKMLSKKEGVEWIHPDGLWDPSMDQRASTFKATELAVTEHKHADIVVIDMQFRHQFMLDAFDEYGVTIGKQVLLYCNTPDREYRLRARGLEEDVIATMEH
jgi:broad-specificity NMP kinase